MRARILLTDGKMKGTEQAPRWESVAPNCVGQSELPVRLAHCTAGTSIDELQGLVEKAEALALLRVSTRRPGKNHRIEDRVPGKEFANERPSEVRGLARYARSLVLSTRGHRTTWINIGDWLVMQAVDARELSGWKKP